ncbi:hypothetical protein E2562_003571 [Oryza meyeriana var. granulata]|uniref:Uncharacterized protein n=1 Tax=Oryza meyeriana var. granulata TaxID=110450 RepID=A0A6G1CNA5_9ORYZ|nr:hypothetical protein E2562_003571 [Oryza meyeriana var. granulata]
MARQAYKQAVDVLDPDEEDAELLLLSFANFEQTHEILQAIPGGAVEEDKQAGQDGDHTNVVAPSLP